MTANMRTQSIATRTKAPNKYAMLSYNDSEALYQEVLTYYGYPIDNKHTKV